MRLLESFSPPAFALLLLLSASTSLHAQNWKTQSSMTIGRVEATTIDYRDNIYVFNGFKPGIKIANSVEKYNVATKQWSNIGSTTTMNDSAVTHNGVVRVGAEVWILGGRVGNHPGRVTDKVWIYNLENGKWRKGPALPVPSAAGGAALVNNKVHWLGGLDQNASCDVANHFVYDLNKPNAGWKNITATAAVPDPRNHFSTAVVNNIIYIIGGQYGHDNCPGKRTNDTASVHAFNTATTKWSKKADMPSKNSHSEPGTFVYKNNIYTTGGEHAGDKVFKYNPTTNKWSIFKTLPESLVAPIARIIDGHLIVAGGGAPRAALATAKVRSLLIEPSAVGTAQVTPEVIVEPAPPVEPEPGSQTPAGDTLISMEAEYFDLIDNTPTHQWVSVNRADSANNNAMITTPDQGTLASTTKNTPMLSYMVYFNHPGKHYIWVRGSGDTNGSGIGSSDSIHIGLNGTVQNNAFRIDQFPSKWTWSRHTPINPVASLNVINAGVNMLNIWMREDGLAIDKFVITNDPDFVPSGHGPVLTDGTDNYSPPVINVEQNSDIALNDSVDESPTKDTGNPVTTETVNPSIDQLDDGNQSIVNETTAEETAESESSSNIELVDNSEPDTEATNQNAATTKEPLNTVVEAEIVEGTVVNTVSNPSKGLFGGSVSFTTILVMFSLLLVRASRYFRNRSFSLLHQATLCKRCLNALPDD